MGRACCDPKRGAGKCLVFFFTIVFGLGVIVSTSSPSWIAFTAADVEKENASREIEWGPFYGRTRACTTPEGGEAKCDKWETKSIEEDDCDVIEDSNGDHDLGKLCRQINTWRTMAILCLALVLVGGGLVMAASYCQAVTCGCCGNSLTCISNALFGAEVVLSIVAWSFAISSLRLIQGKSIVTSSGYEWGFWLFVASGTVVGSLATWTADWAAEDSCLRGVWHCLTCKPCRKRRNDNELQEPLV